MPEHTVSLKIRVADTRDGNEAVELVADAVSKFCGSRFAVVGELSATVTAHSHRRGPKSRNGVPTVLATQQDRP